MIQSKPSPEEPVKKLGWAFLSVFAAIGILLALLFVYFAHHHGTPMPSSLPGTGGIGSPQ